MAEMVQTKRIYSAIIRLQTNCVRHHDEEVEEEEKEYRKIIFVHCTTGYINEI